MFTRWGAFVYRRRRWLALLAIVVAALSGAFAAREKKRWRRRNGRPMGALNLPSASDLDKLERRIRSISHRLDEVEDTVERVLDKLDSLNGKLDESVSSRSSERNQKSLRRTSSRGG